jgi:IclR family acetate operon transcriptional repressor
VEGAQVVDRVALLLSLVADSTYPPNVTNLAKAAGLSLSTTSRLVHGLLGNRLLARDQDGRLFVGFAVLHAAQSPGIYSGLVDASVEALDSLAAETRETVNLAVPEGNFVEHLAQRDSGHLIGATNWVGLRAPLHCSSTGKIFLAFGAARLPTRRLVAWTSETITDVEQLEEELERARRDGFATARGELEVGLTAVSVPIYGDSDRVIAALSIAGPSARVEGQGIKKVVGVLKRHSTAITGALHHGQSGRQRRSSS